MAWPTGHHDRTARLILGDRGERDEAHRRRDPYDLGGGLLFHGRVRMFGAECASHATQASTLITNSVDCRPLNRLAPDSSGSGLPITISNAAGVPPTMSSMSSPAATPRTASPRRLARRAPCSGALGNGLPAPALDRSLRLLITPTSSGSAAFYRLV